MCKFLFDLFKPKPAPTLPYPEEAPDYSQTITNVIVESVVNKWLLNYKVPPDYWNYWKTKISITLDTSIMYPAGTWEENNARHMVVRPEWLNAGVIAHEQAHNSYALLPEYEKLKFSVIYGFLKADNPLIKLMYSKNTYGLSSDVEAHAEIYRYLGNQMPEELKPFYPRLF